ncbi:hypothetical protein JXR93_06975 [bacterium]|nr:hypothetical protein [bacterium]
MYNLDITAMITFTETAMEKTPDYFDEAEREQLKIVKEAATLYLERKGDKEISKAVSSVISIDKKELLLKINIVATDIHNHLKKQKLTSRLVTYFRNESVSKNTSSESKSFEFIINCYDKMIALGENSDILEFKDKIVSLYSDVTKVMKSQKDNRLTEITTMSERDVLGENFLKEFKILECMIEIKSLRVGFKKSNYIKRVTTKKRTKNQEKIEESKSEEVEVNE